MGKITGFKEIERKVGTYKAPEDRVKNYEDIYAPLTPEEVEQQAARCMDCGVPFCTYSCPLANNIPDYNDLIYNHQWEKALQILHSTNNFPEFTGKICPALCESGCVLGINQAPITCKQIELAIIEKGWAEGWVVPQPPATRTGKKIAIIGSGPSGLAAAQQLARAGHKVTVFERSPKPGGLLRYGIPDYKLPKFYVDRRVEQMVDEGVNFKCNTHVGLDIPVEVLKKKYDVICLTGGSSKPRDLDVHGRRLKGIEFAMDFLPQQNKMNDGMEIPLEEQINAAGKNVVVIGGGDTGSDCVGTAIRQGAQNVTQLELMPMPPSERSEFHPWPTYPLILRTSTSHDEATYKYGHDIRNYAIATKYFSGENGKVTKLHCVKLEWSKPDKNGRRTFKEIPKSEFTIDADLVLFAMGFLHPEQKGLLTDLGVEFDQRGNVLTDDNYQTSEPNIFSAGDMRRGQSLVVWSISEGRKLAHCVDEHLMGKTYLQTAL
ncbi:glutamate synthase subunit beta [Vallitalea okinawensis]|uniref:glutamate synthase subunit beta n=1 Tax=Vallitalea okinawensis TaxID=2078660 RepID=UPI000CFE0651|nr:glutamate synthase subunit beta [Vallitalea okinawensis]